MPFEFRLYGLEAAHSVFDDEDIDILRLAITQSKTLRLIIPEMLDCMSGLMLML
ncbi:MAG: hypothetical protein IJQ63_12355 [Synergistaceae bacterium]|nr:hypothetical protein [Synergistaceae bacterium]